MCWSDVCCSREATARLAATAAASVCGNITAAPGGCSAAVHTCCRPAASAGLHELSADPAGVWDCFSACMVCLAFLSPSAPSSSLVILDATDLCVAVLMSLLHSSLSYYVIGLFERQMLMPFAVLLGCAWYSHGFCSVTRVLACCTAICSPATLLLL